VLTELGLSRDEADEAVADVRRRDKERLELQLVSGLTAGRSLWRNNVQTPMPEPFTPPRAAAPTLAAEPKQS
jgi:glutathione-regulated potassium-efflux system protein KefB